MSNVERLLNTGAEPAPTLEGRGGVASAEWLRHLERAQWAGLGEGFDRNSPTSAAEARAGERAGHAGRHEDARDGAPPGVAGAATAAVPAEQKPGPSIAAAFEHAEGALSAAGPAIPPVATTASGPAAHGCLAAPDIALASAGPGIDASTHAASPASPASPAAAKATPMEAAAIASAATLSSEGRRGGVSVANGNATRPGEVSANAQPGTPRTAIERRASAAAVEPAGEESAAAPPPKPVAPRSIRVFTDADGARIVVRDASLDAPAAQALVARIVAELAMGGARLSEVTINGAKVFESTPGATDGGIRAVRNAEKDEQGR